ncbi:hypothetical protein [Bosea sp. 117]|uniref:hypothetical protein n=1 Tax=Bosea sp. 117 TaxID=1125973 RepID=UPI000494D803|nr:hypothetical protein [Bosea sp. 117]
MDALLRLLLRFLVVPLGYIAGMLATMVVVVVGYWQLGELLSNVTEMELFAVMEALLMASLALAALVTTMWLVATIGILFAEAFAIRAWLYHTANGAISAFVGAQLFTPDAGDTLLFDGDLYILAAGLAGGLAYWAVAGWSAGFWKPVWPAPQPALPPAPTASALPPPAPPSAPQPPAP